MFLIMNVLRSSPAFLVCLNTSSTDLQLDFINVTKVTTRRIKAFSCLLFGEEPYRIILHLFSLGWKHQPFPIRFSTSPEYRNNESLHLKLSTA